jgi:hypothetical protein
MMMINIKLKNSLITWNKSIKKIIESLIRKELGKLR